MKALRLGVAVAAAPMRDAVLGEPGAEAAAGEGRAVVGSERQVAGSDAAAGDGVVDERGRLLAAAAQLERPADDLAGAAVDRRVQVAPTVLGNPDRGHVQVPELVGALDAEEARTTPPAKRPVPLQQPLLAHHPLRPLAIDLAAELAARQRRHHPGAVGQVRTRDIDDQTVDRIDDSTTRLCRSPLRRPIEAASVDLQHARDHRRPSALGDQLAEPGGACPHSQPRNASPAISSS